ncbi:hypothetical protein [Symbiopectobacterium purcellii]|uniref:hypothetical protein n=1 Tax=Symbiopectobacterium purcellii TaxID=2871826 RepID=UPI003F8326D6
MPKKSQIIPIGIDFTESHLHYYPTNTNTNTNTNPQRQYPGRQDLELPADCLSVSSQLEAHEHDGGWGRFSRQQKSALLDASLFNNLDIPDHYLETEKPLIGS